MTPITVESARRFVEQADVPEPRRTRGAAHTAVQPRFDAATTQTAVVGSDIISFVNGVTPDRRDAIVNSSLLAQLVAKKQVPDPNRVYDWYNAYFDVLTNIGWVLQDRSFAEYRESGTNVDVHKAILSVAATVLGPSPAALALVTTTLNALQSMDESTPWIALFNRESQSARTARFQISLAEQDAAGQFFVSLMAFGLEAKATLTQVLFVRVKKEDATLRHYSGRVTINTTVLDGVRDAIKQKIMGVATNYVSALPDLG